MRWLRLSRVNGNAAKFSYTLQWKGIRFLKKQLTDKVSQNSWKLASENFRKKTKKKKIEEAEDEEQKDGKDDDDNEDEDDKDYDDDDDDNEEEEK